MSIFGRFKSCPCDFVNQVTEDFMLSLLVAFFLAAPPQQAPPVRARLPQAPPVREAPCLCQATGECACKVCTCQKAATVHPVQLTAKAPENPYPKARASAITNNRPLVVFVGVVRPERIEGMDVVSLTTSQWAEYSGELENAIIVSLPVAGSLKWVVTLPPTASEQQIRAEIETARRPRALPVQQPVFTRSFAGCST